MHVFLQIVIGLGLFVKISAVNERENLMKMFSDERKEMREEQREMRAVFQRENAELRAQNDKQAQEIKKLHNQDKHLHEKLRQRDKEEGPRLEARIRNAITEERHSSDLENVVESVVKRSIRRGGRNDSLETELKKLINSEINNFLTNERICVGSKFEPKSKAVTTRIVDYGYTFPRIPAFSASFSVVDIKPRTYYPEIQVQSVTNSSAKIQTFSGSRVCVSWLACM